MLLVFALMIIAVSALMAYTHHVDMAEARADGRHVLSLSEALRGSRNA